MTVRYVRKTGSDANDGSSPSSAYLTINYAVDAARVAAGDIIYVGAGTYRERITALAVSLGSETWLIGDTDGSKTGDAGEVIVTAFLTNDTTAPAGASSSTIYCATSVDHWTLENLTIIGASTGGGNAGSCVFTNLAHYLTLRNCTFIGHMGGRWCVTLDNYRYTAPAHVLIERCRIYGVSEALFLGQLPDAGATQVDMDIVVRNNIIWAIAGAECISLEGVTAGNHLMGGTIIKNNLIISPTLCVNVQVNTYLSTTYPALVYNNILIAGGLTARHAGEIVEDYNILYGGYLTNVTAGTNTIADGRYMTAFHFGQELAWGGVPRPFGMPVKGSPLFGFGSFDASVTDDLLGGPRPGSGIGSLLRAVGPFERGNSGTREAVTIRSGAFAIKLLGPGYQDVEVAVAVASTTISVYGRFDGTYAGGKPSMKVLNGGEAGVADATATMTGAANTWEQLTLNFTPTKPGIVTVRLMSSDTNGGGAAFFDDLTAT